MNANRKAREVRMRDESAPGSSARAPKTLVSAHRIAVALATAATLVACVSLTGVAWGTPSCQPGVWGQSISLSGKTCRDANETVSGKKHEERVYWEQIAGAPHPADAVIDASPTPLEADLFSVRARNAREVIAGGAICEEGTKPEDLESCDRVPVIYSSDEETGWQRAYLSPPDKPGYVGAVAWIGKGRALAVGGTGIYPRREPNPAGDSRELGDRVAYDIEHGAGDARAWYFHDANGDGDSEWEEISEQLPEDMGGLTALDVWIGREPDGEEWGLAGDYGHIWEWRAGEFTGSHIDSESPAIGAPDPEWAIVNGPVLYVPNNDFGAPPNSWRADTAAGNSDASLFQYRVREIRIAPDRNQKRAIAFTAGCCGPPTTSRRIEYVPRPKKSQSGVIPPEAPPPAGRPRWVVLSGGQNNVHDSYGDSVYSFVLKPGRYSNGYGGPDEFGEAQAEHNSLTWSIDVTNGLVKAAGGSDEAPADPVRETAPEEADTVSPLQPRYVASDGDVESTDTSGNGYTAAVSGNGIPDWKVGEANDPELHGLGILATTREDLKPYYGGVRPYCGNPSPPSNPFANHINLDNEIYIAWAAGVVYPDESGICRAQQIQAGAQPALDPEGPIKVKESGIQYGPSWALNGVEILDSENIGYAVGDRGAIVRMSSPPAESDPPSLGARRPAQLADRSLYDEHRPEPASTPGEVPPLATQPREALSEERMVHAGSPDGNEIGNDLPVEDVNTIVMSRDGSEGWAIGPSIEARGNARGGVITLHHYQDGQWTRCDPVGIPGIKPPDRACAELGQLYQRREANGRRTVLDAAARIPFEYDSNPANDDKFEVLAVGSELEVDSAGGGTRNIPAVIRYANGRWQLEDFEIRATLAPPSSRLEATSLACIAPDECWLAGWNVGGITKPYLSRYTGEGWIRCSTRRINSSLEADGTPTDPLFNRAECGDLANRVSGLNLVGSGARLSVASAAERVYLGATRQAGGRQIKANFFGADEAAAAVFAAGNSAAILYKDYGKDEQWQAEGGGHDPAVGGDDDESGPLIRGGERLDSVAVAKRPDGRYEGWAAGIFGPKAPFTGWPLMRLDPETGEWDVWGVKDAAYDLLGPPDFRALTSTSPPRQLTLPGEGDSPGRAYIAGSPVIGSPGVVVGFEPKTARWEVLQNPSTLRPGASNNGRARPLAFAPDGRGGAWAAYGTRTDGSVLQSGLTETYYYNYTTTPRREVFSETPAVFGNGRERITDLAGAADGTVWASTDRGVLYRYDRLAGWEQTTVPGWDPGRVVIRPTPIDAIALGPGGSGLALGEDGRIARLSPDEVRLDDAAGTVCAPEAAEAPCGTSFDLTAAAIAPDGSAIVAGEKLALLWRAAGRGFARIAAPDAPTTATITGVSMPAPDRAFLALDSGQLFAGTNAGGVWRWSLENSVEVAGVERLLTDRNGEPGALYDIAVDATGHGFAVGDHGVILERAPGESQTWRRVESGVSERLTSVALPAGEGSGALVGGERGLILTYTAGAWRLARAGDQLRPDNGYVAGVALLPGVEDGQAEAWAAVAGRRGVERRSGMNQLLHYSSAPSEPLLDPERNAAPLPDVPEPRQGEISFAAFGRTDCLHNAYNNQWPCLPFANGYEPEQVLLRRVREEVLERSREPGGPQFTLWTGDPYDTANNTGLDVVEQNSKLATETAIPLATGITGLGADGLRPGAMKYRRFNEQLTDYLPARGLPLFAAIGARDLSETRWCQQPTYVAATQPVCVENRDRPRVGENIAWRQGMEEMPAPWGAGEPAVTEQLAFEPVRESGLQVRREDQEVDDPTDELPETSVAADLPEVDTLVAGKAGGHTKLHAGGHEEVDDRPVPTGGASTHYAVDVLSTTDDPQPIARLVFADTSAGSLAASDPLQEPLEAEGGQAAWLERVLCVEGGPFDTGQCTRDPHQQAIVVSTTPTYSYGPTNPTETQADATVFESILLRHQANVVVSGRLGWNGRYWATAPGVHEPCPGQGYVPDSKAPEPGARACGQGVAGLSNPSGAASQAQGAAFEAVAGAGGTGILPFVVASTAGGRFDEFAERSGADANDGLWRGYSIVRLHPSGDPRKTIVEQRPIFDWVGISGAERVLSARERLRLHGVGREPISVPVTFNGAAGGARFDELTSPAITHRYDLVLADPDGPWAPCSAADAGCRSLQAKLSVAPGEPVPQDAGGTENPCEPYLCLPERVGAIDRYSGTVEAGNGKYPDTFAIALLSAGDNVAAYPLAFKRSPSFVVLPLQLSPQIPSQPAATAGAPPPPPPPPPPTPSVPQVSTPALPSVPPIAPLQASQPPEPQPPAPPAPPPPIEQLNPLSLALAPPSPVVATPTAVIQPPTPPVNPAPPGGARREARQRQAAAQKSGADNEESQGGLSDTADGPPSASGSQSMTRRDHAYSRGSGLAFGRSARQHRNGGARMQGLTPSSEPSFTPLARTDQPSAWAQGALYTGGLTLMALALAAGWPRGRPTPKRRPPEVPAAATARVRSKL